MSRALVALMVVLVVASYLLLVAFTRWLILL